MRTAALVIVLISIMACDREVLPPSDGCTDDTITYETSTKEIINLTCAYSGCHDGAGGAPGDFTTYSAMERYLRDGSFTERVIDMRDNPARGMPPNKSIYPNSLQDDLTPTQLQVITCWIENDFPQ